MGTPFVTLLNNMADGVISLLDGSYRTIRLEFVSAVITGNKAVIKSSDGSTQDIDIESGQFGEADPEIVEFTGKKFYNIRFTNRAGMNKLGIVNDDGTKVSMKGIIAIGELQWMSVEEAAAFEGEGDPVEAPPGPYKVQPDHLGKFLWITGSPGLGKSTSAHLLNKIGGYVYYETDCFGACRNPYISDDATNPSKAVALQKPLQGGNIEKRKEVVREAKKRFSKLLADETFEFKLELGEEMYGMMCEDIKKERKRIGGDWAVAGVTFNKEVRDFIRDRLGADLVFVYLTMEVETVKERLKIRHPDNEELLKVLMKIHKMCEAAAE